MLSVWAHYIVVAPFRNVFRSSETTELTRYFAFFFAFELHISKTSFKTVFTPVVEESLNRMAVSSCVLLAASSLFAMRRVIYIYVYSATLDGVMIDDLSIHMARISCSLV
jgi:hypothetical protein